MRLRAGPPEPLDPLHHSVVRAPGHPAAGLAGHRHGAVVLYPSLEHHERGKTLEERQPPLEAKALGTPKHPGSPKAKPLGRAGSADVDKRIKEIGFKTIDLKAEYARMLAAHGTSPTSMAGDLTTWLRSVKPTSFVFLAARVISDKDQARLIRLADNAALVSDAVGVFCFRPVSPTEPTRYRVAPVPSHLELSRVLFRACQELGAIKARQAGNG